MAREPATVIRAELGNFFHLRRDSGGRNVEWSPA
jgi:hypothetical protein